MDNVFIGAGSRIMYNTRIGSNVIIASGSVVTKDVPDNSVYAGVPARFICSFDDYVVKAYDYSQYFKESYGLDRLPVIDDKFAQKLYSAFLVERICANKMADSK